MTVLFYFSLCIFLLVSFLLCAVVLMQESKSSGLGSSFGGDAGDSLFGTATADILKKFTGWLAIAFMAGCVILSLWTSALGYTGPAEVPVTIEQEG